MQRRRFSAPTAAAIAIGTLVLLSAAAPIARAQCDENDTRSPTRSHQITLTASDATDESRSQFRTFVATGSLGRAEVRVVSATPPGIVRSVTATPHLSRYSRLYGEELKGVTLAATLLPGGRGAKVIVNLRQVCAQYFRDSFLND